MIEELEADATAETGFRGTANATASVEQRGVAVCACTSRGSQDVEERVDGLFTLVPEYFTCSFRS